MSGDKGASFPIAAAVVVALLASATFVGPRAFDLLRLAENDTAKQGQLLQPPVEARLWEDPLAALARHRTKFNERCREDKARFDKVDAAKPKHKVGQTPEEASGDKVSGWSGVIKVASNLTRPDGDRQSMPDRGPTDDAKDLARDPMCDVALGKLPLKRAGLTVIATLLPGADFLGVEEQRRRIRYALLAGLAAEGFVPERSDRIGFFSWASCDPACAKGETRLDILYETFKTEGTDPRHAVVLWLSDVAVGSKWLGQMVKLVAHPVFADAKLRIVGPHDSDKLLTALAKDTIELKKNADLQKVLVRTTLVSPWSTTPGERLRELMAAPEAPGTSSATGAQTPPKCDAQPSGSGRTPAELGNDRDPLDRQFLAHLDKIRPGNSNVPFFVRSISTDDRQVELLAKELKARGLGSNHRIVLLREWDSVYARSLADSLKSRLGCLGWPANGTNFRVYSYLRGVDGANLDGATKDVRLVPRKGGDKAGERKDPALEWPESRDQRDYVRRLVHDIQREADEDGVRVVAVGIFGNDVHDKLVLAQALRATLADRLLFTTDLDARLMHPEVLSYTRNMVIASSLPLVPPVLEEEQEPKQEPFVRIAPFRDSYQTAAFLGARYAASDEPERRLGQIHKVALEGRLFEIGRNGEVELGIDKVPEGEEASRRLYFWASTITLAVLAFVILIARPGPAMKAAFAKPAALSTRGFVLSTAVICGLTVAAWGFASGVVLELRWPGLTGLSRSLLIALVCAVVFFALIYPGIGRRPKGPGRRKGGAVVWWSVRLSVQSLIAIAAVGWLAWSLHQAAEASGMREPFGASNGVSAWPSQLLRTLALLLFPWFLDRAWNGGVQAARSVGERYFAYVPPEPRRCRLPTGGRRLRWRMRRLGEWLGRRLQLVGGAPRTFLWTRWRRTWRALAASSLWFWQPRLVWARKTAAREADRRVDGRRLWQAYFLLLRNGARLCRLVFWLAITFVLVGGIVKLLGAEWPDNPVRGADRTMFIATNLAAVLCAVILLVLVSNAAVLTCRFILIMKDGRTVYPRTTVDRFAAELGPNVAARPQLYYPIAVRAADRNRPGVDARNSLLDPWIDARLLAKHTAAIGPLIVFPFILLGLLIVARSRLFDNWDAGTVLVVLGFYLLWAAGMAALLNLGAEMARRKALDDLARDLLWLNGAGADYKPLADQFPKLIDQVRDLREGAFAPFFEQPLVRAILVPLGGAGGIQVLEAFLLVRGG